jgi:hypothetical protein
MAVALCATSIMPIAALAAALDRGVREPCEIDDALHAGSNAGTDVPARHERASTWESVRRVFAAHEQSRQEIVE